MKRLERQRKTKTKTMRSAKIKKNQKRIVPMKKMKVMMRNLKTQKILDKKTLSLRHMSNNKLRRKDECRQCSTRTRNVKCRPGIKCLKILNLEAKVMKVRLASTYKTYVPPASNSTQTNSISSILRVWLISSVSYQSDKII